ncbi:unnamed protein product [Symbiodinium sp. CCMP2592]|nr:unnamed protein product [Symbiodinium sp. CCMP2592]
MCLWKVLNWQATKLFGFSGPSDAHLTSAAKVLAAAADGQTEDAKIEQVESGRGRVSLQVRGKNGCL